MFFDLASSRACRGSYYVVVTPRTSQQSRFRGCLLGGAVGDALGAPVEFLSMPEIISRFGPDGIRDFASAYGRVGAITDDTQMTLFTAEGVLRAAVRYENKGICDIPSVVHHSYLRWLKTQGERSTSQIIPVAMDGWLIGLHSLWNRRAPGGTCLFSLGGTQHLGDIAQNDSKGCGGVMRVAPVGLVTGTDEAFELGSQVAALTHGHPSGSLSAGFLAYLIRRIVNGASLEDAMIAAKEVLTANQNHEEVLEALEAAEQYAASRDLNALREGRLGDGWIAEEALSIAVYCALLFRNFEGSVVAAVNHAGDSDSTGAITGNICGALYGVESIPDRWVGQLELRSEITEIADDLAALDAGVFDATSETTGQRYPGY
jgi:ADP-ribosyl-[dinitrogen reductase] hydrolase